jgi:Cys-rich repeat protein
MRTQRGRAALRLARGGFLLGACAWCCSLYEGRTLEFFADPSDPSVECRSASECTRERKFCVGGACRECLVDGDCGRDRPICVSNVCVECSTSSHCASGQGCNEVLSTCAFACSEASDCAGQALIHCSSELDLCVQCLDDGDCSEPRNPACDRGGRCVECMDASHCPPDRPSCDVPSRRCVECADSSACDGRVCDPRNHRCVECLSDADCGAGTCDVERRRCIQPCAGGADCDPKRPICDATRSCIECETREHCPDSRRPACTPEHQCVECLTQADCTEPGKPACLMTSQRCGECTGPEHCSESQRCDLVAARCVPLPRMDAPMDPAAVDPGPGGRRGSMPDAGLSDGGPLPAPGP